MKTVLIGPPNSGKTTLYNWLTGHQAKVVNYPGSTVDYSSGKVAPHWTDLDLEVIDSPGSYSLIPKSEDEEVTFQLLKRLVESKELRNVILVMDPTQIQRHLHLALQIKAMGLPMIVVLTMKDLLEKQKISVKLDEIQSFFAASVVQVDGRLGQGLEALISEIHKTPGPSEMKFKEPIAVSSEETRRLAACFIPELEKTTQLWSWTLKLDRLFLHPILGYFVFFVLMSLLFTSVYSLATPIMDYIEGAFSYVTEFLTQQNPDSLFFHFIANGVISSFASVLVFIPQIFILFLFLALLEGSGYLARAATIIDKPFSKMGLSGRSFVPFLSGYACAVPALMATRNIHSKREKWVARMIIPLLSCSARLPVYGLLLSLLFWKEEPWKPGLALSGLYILSMIVATFAAGVLNRFLKAGQNSLFAMELPLYRMPLFKTIFWQAFQKAKSFVTRAGPVIFILSIFLWLGMNFPQAPKDADATTQLEMSYLGRAGQEFEPIFEPMGLDWRGGVGLMAAFAAREVFVSTLAVLYHSPEEAGDAGLMEQLKEAKNSKGETIYTPSVIMGLLVFFMIALQCLSTVGVMIKESQSVKLGILQLVAFNVLGYGFAVAITQGLRAFGIS